MPMAEVFSHAVLLRFTCVLLTLKGFKWKTVRYFFSFSSFSIPNISNSFLPNNICPPIVCRCRCQCCPFHSGNNPAVTCDFISPTWLGQLKLLLFHRLFPSAKGRCCRGGATGGSPILPLLQGCSGLWEPAAEEGSAAPGDHSESPRPRLQDARRIALRSPASPGHPTSPPRLGPGASSPPKFRINLCRDTPPPRFTPRLYLMTLNEPFSLSRTWPVGDNCRVGKDEVPL